MDAFRNNEVILQGLVISDLEYSHEVFGEKFYSFLLGVKRLSDTSDCIPIMISENFIEDDMLQVGDYIHIIGRFSSYNLHQEERNKLLLYVAVQGIEVLENTQEYEFINNIFLDGYVCKKPTYRQTPLGRNISDLLIAANRSYGKSDYLPAICWSNNACWASCLEVGTHIQIKGRIQSRVYVKKLGEEEIEERVAYEISVSKLTI
ncbi:MAG: single-stranded DNA-binding protein [Agathobacter sp.]|nr:single-stranded DNA-binding protein [Agathobacter sp.]